MKIFIVFVLFAITCVTAESIDKKCLDDHFQNSTAQDSNCEKVISKYSKEFNETFTLYLKDADINDNYDENCAFELVEKYRFADFYLKGVLNHLTHKTNKTKFENDVFYTMRDLAGTLYKSCNEDAGLQRIFDEPTYGKQQEKRDTPYALCRFKNAINEGIIAPTDYDINITLINSTNCEEFFKDINMNIADRDNFILGDVFGIPTKMVAECIFDGFVELKWLSKIETYTAISTLKLLDQQRKELYKELIAFNKFLHIKIYECLQKMF